MIHDFLDFLNFLFFVLDFSVFFGLLRVLTVQEHFLLLVLFLDRVFAFPVSLCAFGVPLPVVGDAGGDLEPCVIRVSLCVFLEPCVIRVILCVLLPVPDLAVSDATVVSASSVQSHRSTGGKYLQVLVLLDFVLDSFVRGVCLVPRRFVPVLSMQSPGSPGGKQ